MNLFADKNIYAMPNLNILTTEGYFQRFYEILSAVDSNKAAYSALEKEYREIMKEHWYSTYESFRKAKCLYMKKQPVTKGNTLTELRF